MATYPTYLNTHDAAAVLGLSFWTLTKWRAEDRGPPYRRFGKKVVYDLADLDAYATAQTVRPASGE